MNNRVQQRFDRSIREAGKKEALRRRVLSDWTTALAIEKARTLLPLVEKKMEIMGHDPEVMAALKSLQKKYRRMV